MNDKEAIDAYVDGGLGMASAAISLINSHGDRPRVMSVGYNVVSIS